MATRREINNHWLHYYSVASDLKLFELNQRQIVLGIDGDKRDNLVEALRIRGYDANRLPWFNFVVGIHHPNNPRFVDTLEKFKKSSGFATYGLP